MKKTMKKALAIAMTLALSVSALPTTTDKADAAGTDKPVKAEDTATTSIDTVKNALTELVEGSLNFTGDRSMTVYKYNEQSSQVMAETYTGYLAKKYKGLKYAAPVFANPDNAIMVTLASGTMRIYNVDDQITREVLPADVTLKNVKEIRKISDSKITVKQVKGKKTTYTTYALTTKLKKSNIYTKNKKTYKKGKKKIKKKAFNKYVKSYKKLKKLSLKKAYEADLAKDILAFYDLADQAYYSENEYMYKQSDWGNEFTEVMKHDKNNTSDPYHVFMEQAGSLVRFILAPNVTDPKTGESYQKEDWDKLVKRNMYMRGSGSTFNADINDILSNPDNYTVEGPEKGLNKIMPASPDEKVTRYLLHEKDTERQIAVDIYEEGEFAGKVCSVDVGYPESAPTSMYFYLYDWDIETDGQWVDPAADAYCYPSAEFTEETRELTLHYGGANSAIKDWTVKTAKKVMLDFPWLREESEAPAQSSFYLKTSDGKEVWLPLAYGDDHYDSFESDLNIDITGGYDVEDNLKNGIYWKEI